MSLGHQLVHASPERDDDASAKRPRLEGQVDASSSRRHETAHHHEATLVNGNLNEPDLTRLTRYRLQCTLVGHRKPPTSVAFSSDGHWLASASGDSLLQIHSLETQQLYRVLKGHTAGVSHVAFSPSSPFLASASDDHTIRIWEFDGSTEDSYSGQHSARTLQGHSSAVICISWNPGGNLLASGGMDESVRVWDVQRGECLKVLPAHSDPVSAVDFNRDGTIIVSCSWDGHVRLWDTSTGQCLKTLVDADNTPFSHVKFTPNSKFLFASTLNSTVRLWDHHTDKTLKSYTGHVNRKFCIPSSLDATGRSVVAGSEDGRIFIWDLQSREVSQCIDAHKDAVVCVTFHPSKQIIASAALDKDSTIKIWAPSEVDSIQVN